jgi:hypothetical protein
MAAPLLPDALWYLVEPFLLVARQGAPKRQQESSDSSALVEDDP